MITYHTGNRSWIFLYQDYFNNLGLYDLLHDTAKETKGKKISGLQAQVS